MFPPRRLEVPLVDAPAAQRGDGLRRRLRGGVYHKRERVALRELQLPDVAERRAQRPQQPLVAARRQVAQVHRAVALLRLPRALRPLLCGRGGVGLLEGGEADADDARAEGGAVHELDGLLCGVAVEEGDEAVALGLARRAPHDPGLDEVAELGERLREHQVSDADAEVADEDGVLEARGGGAGLPGGVGVGPADLELAVVDGAARCGGGGGLGALVVVVADEAEAQRGAGGVLDDLAELDGAPQREDAEEQHVGHPPVEVADVQSFQRGVGLFLVLFLSSHRSSCFLGPVVQLRSSVAFFQFLIIIMIIWFDLSKWV